MTISKLESTSPVRVARWRYVVPNAITLAGLLLGLTSCFRSMEGDTIEAAWLILLCVLIDKLDGTAARVLGATSQIGVQLDSFADFVTFGIAPATMLFAKLNHMGTVADPSIWDGVAMGWVLRGLAAVYVLGACIRLAKFNVLTDEADGPQVFWGLASTFCGGFMGSVFVVAGKYNLESVTMWMPVVAGVLGLLMVSNIPLPKLAKQKSNVINAILVASIVCGYICGIFRIFPEFLVFLLGLYIVWGVPWGIRRRKTLVRPNLDPYSAD